MKMRVLTDAAKIIFSIAIAVVLVGAVVWWEVYKYQDCRKVGHTKPYCIGKIGR